MIKIVDYGVGNIQAFMNMYKRLGITIERATKKDQLATATHFILPGVGSFDYAMNTLNRSGLRESLETLVLSDSIPILGVCVGMQMLANSSEEGKMPGLGWIPGRVRAFSSFPECDGLAMPHMGWNSIEYNPTCELFTGVESLPRFYFLHSYFYQCENPEDVSARASYGLDIHCSVSKRHIHGVQFHPEKSHHYGAALLKNFSEI